MMRAGCITFDLIPRELDHIHVESDIIQIKKLASWCMSSCQLIFPQELLRILFHYFHYWTPCLIICHVSDSTWITVTWNINDWFSTMIWMLFMTILSSNQTWKCLHYCHNLVIYAFWVMYWLTFGSQDTMVDSSPIQRPLHQTSRRRVQITKGTGQQHKEQTSILPSYTLQWSQRSLTRPQQCLEIPTPTFSWLQAWSNHLQSNSSTFTSWPKAWRRL